MSFSVRERDVCHRIRPMLGWDGAKLAEEQHSMGAGSNSEIWTIHRDL